MKIFIAHASSFDFRKELYLPLRNSSINKNHQITLPREYGEEKITKEIIRSQDLLIAEVSHPSTGQGIELGWANIFAIPIVGVYRKGATPSPATRYVIKNFLEYTDAEDLIEKLNEYLARS